MLEQIKYYCNLVLNNVSSTYKQNCLCIFQRSALSVVHWQFQVNTSHLCKIQTGSWLALELFVTSPRNCLYKHILIRDLIWAQHTFPLLKKNPKNTFWELKRADSGLYLYINKVVNTNFFMFSFKQEIGDVENWARSIEMDMRTIATALEYVHKGQLQSACS